MTHLDNSAKNKSGYAAVGFCIRNHEGQLIRARALNCGRNSILVSEALSLRAGIQEAKRMGLPNVHIEGENLCVINSLKEKWSTPWGIKAIVADISYDLNSFTHQEVAHCFKKQTRRRTSWRTLDCCVLIRSLVLSVFHHYYIRF